MSITNEDLFKLIQSGNKEIKQEIKDFRNHVAKEIDVLKNQIKNLEEENHALKNKLLHFERKQKKYNIVVYGIEEKTSHKSEEVLNIINEKLDLQLNKTDFRDIYRVGKEGNEKTRPVIVETARYQTKLDILNKSKTKQPELKKYKIFFSQDYAEEDYKKKKYLKEQLKAARAKHYKAIIKNNVLIVNGEEFTYENLHENKQQDFENINNTRRNSAPATPTTAPSLESIVDPGKDDRRRKIEETPTRATGAKPKINTRTQAKLKPNN